MHNGGSVYFEVFLPYIYIYICSGVPCYEFRYVRGFFILPDIFTLPISFVYIISLDTFYSSTTFLICKIGPVGGLRIVFGFFLRLMMIGLAWMGGTDSGIWEGLRLASLEKLILCF